MVNAKTLAELVDDKLSKHYELDDSGKKKVRCLLSKECREVLLLGVNQSLLITVLFFTPSFVHANFYYIA